VIHKQDNLSAVHASHALLASFEERAPTEAADVGEAGAAEGRDGRGAGPSGAPGAPDPAGGRGSRISVTVAYRWARAHVYLAMPRATAARLCGGCAGIDTMRCHVSKALFLNYRAGLPASCG
jgi:hypothetical protein